MSVFQVKTRIKFTWNGSTNRKVQDAEILVVKIYIGTSDTLARAQDLLPIKWAIISFNLYKSSRIFTFIIF